MTYEQLELDRWMDDGGYCPAEASPAVPSQRFIQHAAAVYNALAQHQVTEDWEIRELLAWLHAWAEIFVSEFKLQISTFALTVDWLGRRCLGHFRPGHNGFGLKGEIALNRRYLRRESWRILGTLLHELLHAEQEEHGKPGKWNYHNKAFRQRAAQFGLIIDEYGHTQYASSCPFQTLLAARGVQMPELPPPVMHERGKSKLKLWRCPCGVRARVAIADFRAQCLRCQGVFVSIEN